MSEQAPSFESGPDFSKLKVERLLPDAEHAEALRPGEKDPLKALAEARAEIAKTAVEAPAIESDKAASETAARPTMMPAQIDSSLKSITLSRALHSIRRKENIADRNLSKVIHKPAVRVASEAAGKSVSRPSGMLGGGILAFAGSSIYLYLAQHYGFTYNYGVVVLLFAAGFVLGVIIELLVHTATASRRKAL